MKRLILVLLVAGVPAWSAPKCDTDADCTSVALSLIKKATKLKACNAEKLAVAKVIERVASPGSHEVAALDSCVESAKYNAKVDKRAAKRALRIQKALGQ